MSIQSEITRLSGAKSDIADAIEAKGVTVPSTAKLDGYAALVARISADPTLQSKAITPTESAQTVEPDSGYDGLSSVSVGAIPSNYVGTGVTKKMAQTYTPGTEDQTITSGQYLTGVQTIKGDAKLQAENIANGVTIFGVTGTLEGGLSPNNAVIHIVAGVGSTITILKNSVVVKVLDSSKGHVNAINSYLSDYYYSVSSDNFGTWEVASDSYPATKQVTITANQVYDVGMAVLYLYDHGVYTNLYSSNDVYSGASVTEDTTNGWIYINGKANNVQDGYKRWVNVDLTYFNTITSKRSTKNNNSTKNRHSVVFIADALSVVNSRQASIVTDSYQETVAGVISEVVLDISNITGTHHVLVGMNSGGASWGNSRNECIHEVKLS